MHQGNALGFVPEINQRDTATFTVLHVAEEILAAESGGQFKGKILAPVDGCALHRPQWAGRKAWGKVEARGFEAVKVERQVASVGHCRFDGSRMRGDRFQYQVEATVRFENVSFAYERARPILHHVSFEIPAGKTVAVVGPSGSGKSTLARLLYRFYDVGVPGDPPGIGGRITIGGQDIRDVTQASVRQAIGIVPQDTVLFNDTIEYNIAYGQPGATHEEIDEAARYARIHGFIAYTPNDCAAMIGGPGLELSDGEQPLGVGGVPCGCHRPGAR